MKLSILTATIAVPEKTLRSIQHEINTKRSNFTVENHLDPIFTAIGETRSPVKLQFEFYSRGDFTAPPDINVTVIFDSGPNMLVTFQKE